MKANFVFKDIHDILLRGLSCEAHLSFDIQESVQTSHECINYTRFARSTLSNYHYVVFICHILI
jgi:hypothetical protein